MAKTVITKNCSACKQIKPLSEFYKHSGTNDGYQNYCKVCGLEYGKKHSQTESRKTYQKGYIKEYRICHPAQHKAKDAVNHAVRDGKIPPVNTLQCSCGKQAEHYHHPSYAPEHRLDIVAVCIPCHKIAHNS